MSGRAAEPEEAGAREETCANAEDVREALDTAFTMSRYGTWVFWSIPAVALLWLFTGTGAVGLCVVVTALLSVGGALKMCARVDMVKPDTALAMNRYGTWALGSVPAVALLWLLTGLGFIWFCVTVAALLVVGTFLKLAARFMDITLDYQLSPKENRDHLKRLAGWRHLTMVFPKWWREELKAPFVLTGNVEVMQARHGETRVLLLPDKMLVVYGDRTCEILDHADTSMSLAFVHTYSIRWQHEKKDGSPDRRYKNNRQTRVEGHDYVRVDFSLGSMPTLHARSDNVERMRDLAVSWKAAGLRLETSQREQRA